MIDLFTRPIPDNKVRDMEARKRNGTIGICRVTGNRIDRRWMALVPHATIDVNLDKFIAIRECLGLPITDEMRELQKLPR